MRLRLYLFFLTTLTFTFGMSANVEHVVERGETIESIARLYGITPDDILQTNPTAKDMFFAGMVLTIETDQKSASESIAFQSLNPNNEETYSPVNDGLAEYGGDENKEGTIDSNLGTTEEEEILFSKGKNFFGFMIGYFFPKESKTTIGDKKTYSYGFSMMYSLCAGRYFIDNLFGEINLGFSLSSSSTSQYSIGSKIEKREYNFYAIPTSLHIGYTLPFTQRIGLSLYTGPMFSFPAGVSYKVNGEKVETPYKLKTACNWDFGAEVNLAYTMIGGRYTIAMNSEKGNPGSPKGVWMVYLGAKF